MTLRSGRTTQGVRGQNIVDGIRFGQPMKSPGIPGVRIMLEESRARRRIVLLRKRPRTAPISISNQRADRRFSAATDQDDIGRDRLIEGRKHHVSTHHDIRTVLNGLLEGRRTEVLEIAHVLSTTGRSTCESRFVSP